MKVIPPITITDAMLTSSTAVEPSGTETAWVSGTTYALDDVVIRTQTHRKYQRMIAGAGTTAPESDTTNWLDIGPTNKWAMFDTLRNSATSVSGTLTVVLAPAQRINSLALIGLVGLSATITMVVSSVTVYTRVVNLSMRNTLTWTDYYFGTFGQQKALALFDLPPYAAPTITITITPTDGVAACGGVVLGTAVDLGKVEYDAESGALNFSRIERDTFGNAVLIQRRSVPTTNQTSWISKAQVNKVFEVRDTLNAVPALWSALDDKSTDGYFDALLIFGVYKEFRINMSYPENAKVTLQLEEI